MCWTLQSLWKIINRRSGCVYYIFIRTHKNRNETYLTLQRSLYTSFIVYFWVCADEGTRNTLKNRFIMFLAVINRQWRREGGYPINLYKEVRYENEYWKTTKSGTFLPKSFIGVDPGASSGFAATACRCLWVPRGHLIALGGFLRPFPWFSCPYCCLLDYLFNVCTSDIDVRWVPQLMSLTLFICSVSQRGIWRP